MNDLNPLYIIISGWLLISLILLILFLRVRKQLPDLKKGEILFHVKGASGYSNKSFITKAGGASGVLRISIIDDCLHFWTSPGFAAFAKMYDILQAIPIKTIDEVIAEKRNITVCYSSKGELKEFVIRHMNKRDEFIELISELKSK